MELTEGKRILLSELIDVCPSILVAVDEEFLTHVAVCEEVYEKLGEPDAVVVNSMFPDYSKVSESNLVLFEVDNSLGTGVAYFYYKPSN